MTPIDRKIRIFKEVQDGIEDIRRAWYISRERCSADPSYATNIKKIESTFENRVRAEFDLVTATDMVGFSYGDYIKEKLIDFIRWDYTIKNICAKNTPSYKEQQNKNTEIVKLMSNEIAQQQNKISALQKKLGSKEKWILPN